ncbi:hypothetical protein [Cerasicoccus frondis]|uniref:hypothetical protein n=1 Tax=Cerasicoccus frondis TaxID=490090 RepID=UPI0028526FBD|nr:hypothetical protein [Cerasicoccus frondis]
MTYLLNATRAFIGGLFFAQTAFAGDWISIDDFEGHHHDQRVSVSKNWVNLAGFEPGDIVMLENGNHVAQIGPGQAIATNQHLENLAIPEGATGIIYLRFRALADSRYWGGVFGMTSRNVDGEEDLNVGWTLGDPSQGSRPNSTFAVLGSSKDEILVNNRGRMNKAYEDLAPEIKPDIWYDLWVTIDNSRDEVKLFIQGGDFTKRTELTHFRNAKQDVFKFQTASASDLTHFIVFNPTEGSDYNPRSIQVDDINFIVQSSPSAVAAGN